MPDSERLQSAAARTRRAAQVVREQFGLTSSEDPPDPQTRATRRSGRRGGRRRRRQRSQQRAQDDATVEAVDPMETDSDAAAVEATDAGSARSRARRAVSRLRETGGRVVSRGDDDTETSADSAGPRQQVVEGGDSDDSGDGDRGGGLVSRLRERASQAVGAAAADTDDDDGLSPGERAGIKAEAVEQVNDQLDDASVNAGDVEVVEEDGEVTVRLPAETRTEIAAEQVAADTGLEPGKDFEVTLADEALQDLAAGNEPDLEVELTARGRRRRVIEQVKEQGGVKTESGEVIEAEPEDLVFDEEGRVVDIDRGDDGGGGGILNTVAEVVTTPPASAGVAAGAAQEGAEQAALVGTFGTGNIAVDNEAQAALTGSLAAESVAGPAALPSDAAGLGIQGAQGVRFAFGALREEGPVEGTATAASAAADEVTDTAEDVATAAQNRPLTTAGILAAPTGPRGSGLARVGRAGDAAQAGDRVGGLSRSQQAAGGLAAGTATAVGIQQGELSLPEDGAPALGGGEVETPESGDPAVQQPEVGVPEGSDVGFDGEIGVPQSGDPAVQQPEVGVPQDPAAAVDGGEVPVPDQTVTQPGLSTQSLLGRQQQRRERDGDISGGQPRRERRDEELEEILQGPDEAVIGSIGGGAAGSERPFTRREPRRDTVADAGVVGAGVVGGAVGSPGETADGIDTGSETGSEVFDAAFGEAGGSPSAGGLDLLPAGGLAQEPQERQEVAETPAVDTDTTAGLSLTPDIEPRSLADQDQRSDVRPDTGVGADTVLRPRVAQLTDTVQQQQQALAQPPAFPNPPNEGFAPAPEVGQPTETATPNETGVPVRRLRDPDDDDDDDEEPLPGLGFGEAGTPFANPVVGGPEAFGVAGGAAVGGDRDSDESQQPGLGIGVI